MPSSAIMVPSFKNGFARNAGESRYPHLWRGLVGAWAPCLGPTGNILPDWSGRWNRGALTNMDPATDWVVNGQQYALDFDGSNDYVINSGFSINGFSQASLSCWAKIATGQSHNYLVEIPNSSAGSNGMDLFLNGTTTIRAYLYTTSGNSISATYSYAGAGWIHLVNTYDGATHRLYINGVQQASMARSGSISAPANEINFGRFGSAGLYAACQIADVSVWDRGLTQRAITLLSSRRGILYEPREIFVVRSPGGITGTASITQAANTLSSSGAVQIAGTSAITQADQTVDAAGAAAISGDASITQAAESLSGAGAVAISGDAAISQDNNTIAGAGTVAISGSSGVSQDENAVSAVGAVVIVGTASIAQAANTLTASDSEGGVRSPFQSRIFASRIFGGSKG